MASKKQEDSNEQKIAKARKRRLALAEEKTPTLEVSDNREEFRKYFLKLCKKLNLNKSLEEVIWVHLKSIKHDKVELFDNGVKHFGYKI